MLDPTRRDPRMALSLAPVDNPFERVVAKRDRLVRRAARARAGELSS